MKKVYTFVLLSVIYMVGHAQQFLNGSFEINTASGNEINLPNATYNSLMSNSVAFGTDGNMDIITTAFYSGGPEDGNWYVAFTGSQTDAISMTLSAPLVQGNSYTISFWDRGAAGYVPFPFAVGLSTSPTSVGSTIYTAPVAATIGVWTQRIFTFVAPNNGQYITVWMDGGNTGNWGHTDNFTFLCTLNLGPDTTLCTGGSYTINATTANATAYLWQDGSTNPTFTATTTGLYWAQVTANGCIMRDTVNVTFLPPPTVNLGNDTSICAGQNVLLDAGNAGAAYKWQDNSTSQTYNVTQNGTYTVTVTVGTRTASDAINVTVNPLPVVNIGNNTSICGGQSLLLDATTANATYQWQDASTNATYSATQGGTYSVTVTVQGCSASSSVQLAVNPLPVVQLGNDTAICAGQTVLLDAGNAGATYSWQDNSTAETFSASQTGTYSVTVTANTCTASDDIQVTVNPLPVVNLGNDTGICAGQTLILNATIANATYQWQDNSSNPTYSVTQSGAYGVIVTVQGCSASDTIQVTVNPLPVVSLGNDTSVCMGQTVVLDAGNAGATYNWQDNSTAQIFTVSQSGLYSVTASANGCSASGSTQVTVIPLPVVNLGSDTTICSGNPLELNASNAGAAYQWQDSSTNAVYNVTESGTYSVTVSVSVCTASGSVQVTVQPPPVLNWATDTFVCKGSQLVLDATTNNATYLWQDSSTLATFNVTQAGLYSVQVSVAVCTAGASINVSQKQLPVLDAWHDTTICSGNNLVLQLPVQNASYLWNDGTSTNTYTAMVQGIYSVTATNQCGNATDSLTLRLQDCSCRVFMPNIFSPNGDGNNDQLQPEYKCDLRFMHWSIFNRIGEKVFETNELNGHWDGTYKGSFVPPGVYVYVLSYSDSDGGDVQSTSLTGCVTVVR